MSDVPPEVERMAFTVAGALVGARRCLPLALGTFAYGLVFGVLAREAGLSAPEATLMSGLVFAGAAQFVVLGMWGAPLPVLGIILATLIVNLRLVLLGAALRPRFAALPRGRLYGAAFFLTDENWALTLRDFDEGGRDAAFLVGSGLALLAGWTAGGALGRFAGDWLPDPARWGLDFGFTAVFVALLVGMWRGRGDLLPWGVAAVAAVGAERWLPGQWYLLLGGLAGSVAGAWRDAN